MRAKRLLGELLMDAGLVNTSQLEQALQRQRETGEKLGQALVAMEVVQEQQVLEVLSRQMQIALAPEARLRQVRPAQQALRMVSAEVAHERRILPIFYHEQEQSLSLVMADPLDTATLAALKQANNLARLRVLLASERVLQELVTLYYGPPTAQPATASRGAHRPTLFLLEPEDRPAQGLTAWLSAEGYAVQRFKDPLALVEAQKRAPEALVAVRSSLQAEGLGEALSQLPSERLRRLPPAREVLEDATSSSRFADFYVRTLDFFFSLLEQDKDAPSQRHLRQVSQMGRMVASRLGLPASQVDALAIASYLYLFGEYLSRRGVFPQAGTVEASFSQVAELWSSFQPPLPVVGLLQGLAREDAPTGVIPAAVLRVVSTYLEMRDGSKRFVRVGHEKALKHLQEQTARFEPRVVAALRELLAKEHQLGQLEGAATSPGQDILLVDKDAVSLETLELRLTREGFRVRIARTGDEALRQVDAARPHLIISEITLPRMDGFELCARLKAHAEHQSIPFFFLSSRTDSFHVTKGLELGAEDFLTRPVNLDILVTKIRRQLRAVESQQSAPSGVQGSLSELALVDLLQVMQLGMKTAKVQLARGNTRCELYLDQGNLVHASLGELKGREAFFALCTWENGNFQVVPGVKAPEKNIHDSNDFLLMEGMRRADEARAGIGQESKDA